MSVEDATRLFTSCDKLSSLSIAMPKASLRDVDENDYDDYKTMLVSISHEFWFSRHH